MVFVGIDVAKDKHDCYICDSDGVELYSPFIIANNREGFEELMMRIQSSSEDLSKVKVGLEATGHYSYSILGHLISQRTPISLINPLHTILFRKSLSLQTTDEVFYPMA